MCPTECLGSVPLIAKVTAARWHSANVSHPTTAWGTMPAAGIAYRVGGTNPKIRTSIGCIASDALIHHILGQSLLLSPEGGPWFLCKYPPEAGHAVCAHFFLWDCRGFSIYLMKIFYAYYLAMVIAKKYDLASNINALLFYYMLLIILCTAASLLLPL